MGKSATGKDTIYEMLLYNKELDLKEIVSYTTRPIRAKETEGKEYHFVSIEKKDQLTQEGKVIESRCYETVEGPWYYFTVDDENINIKDNNYIIIGTVDSFIKIREYYGKDVVIPIYIEVDDCKRLERAFIREKKQKTPKLEEMCRRFLADQKDFSEERLKEAGIDNRFLNETSKEAILKEISDFIKKVK